MTIHNWDKLTLFAIERLRYTITGKQLDIVSSTKPIKIIRAARRTGKSFNVALITYTLLIYSTITNQPLKILFAGPRFEDTRNMWSHLHLFLKKAPIQGLSVEFDNYQSPSTNKKRMVFSNGTEIKTATTENPEMNDVRGDPWDFIAVDEFGNVEYKREFQDAAGPSLTDQNTLGWLVVIGTPDLSLGDEYDKLFELGQNNDLNSQSWHLTQDDCPNIDREKAKIFDSILSEDGRLREIFGEQVPPGGKLFPEFEYKVQVSAQSYDPTLPYFIGIDPGRTKPVILFVQPKGENFHVFHEITGRDILVDHLISELKLAIEVKCLNNQPVVVGIDKAGNQKSDKVDYTTIQQIKAHFPQLTYTTAMSLVKKENQVMLMRKLTMQKRVYVDPSCKRLSTAILKATPAQSGQHLKAGWAKIDGIDDPLDALMYGLINYAPGLISAYKYIPPTITDDQLDEITDAFL